MSDVVRCSSLHRVMNCKGCYSFKDLYEEPAGDAAKEGTAAGEYLERLLLQKPIGTHASNGVAFDSDMKFYIEPIAERIRRESNGQPIRCEQRIDWQTQSGTMIRGQYDVSWIDETNNVLHIDDLKYGWGIVEAYENWQLLGYAIGEVLRLNRGFSAISMRIIQPRPHHENGSVRQYYIAQDELLTKRDEIEKIMAERAAGDLSVTTGKHCKYCPAAATACTAMNRSFYRTIEETERFFQDDLRPEEISHQLQLIARMEDVLKNKKDSLTQLAIHKIKNGELIPNYTTKDKKSHRKWKKGISPDFILAMTGVNVTEQTMISPAKAEKAGINKDFMKNLCESHFLGQELKYQDTGKLGDQIFGEPK